MHGLVGERTLMRIAVSAMDEHHGRPVYRAIVDLLRERGFAGATVLPCIMGFGARRIVYSAMNEVSSMGLPVIVEAVETEERIAAVLPEIDRIIRGGVIPLERARVVLYRPDAPDDAPVGEEPGSWSMDVIGDWRTAPPPGPA
jgi:uncharacterized protein